MLALWVAQRLGPDGNVHHASLLARHADRIDPVTFRRAEEVLYRRLGASLPERPLGERAGDSPSQADSSRGALMSAPRASDRYWQGIPQESWMPFL